MTQAQAAAAAQALAAHLRGYGLTVSVELQAGAGSNGWGPAPFVATMGHHTVSRRSQGPTPCLRLVKLGRPDLPAPLCNGYLGWDGVARIITMGYANHPGAGGPVTLDGMRIPANNGRPYLFGWEMEGGVLASDWTPEYRRAMAACFAGTLDWLGASSGRHLEHRTWTTRKVDRLGYDAETARAEIRAVRAAPTPTVEDDMYDAAAESRLMARLDAVSAAAAASAAAAERAAAAAQEANARAAAAERAAERARNEAEQATAAARAALVTAQKGDPSAALDAALRALDEAAARAPRVNTARYERTTAPTYEVAAVSAPTYLDLSGALVGVSASLRPGDAEAIGAAVRVPPAVVPELVGTVRLTGAS